ncbi:MAG TPA: FAD-dependent oxidoreductase [Planctomycetes bacterium]|nr:FAD-dependent oxidoreductase [Planctomycetota bacterium]
MIGGGFGGLEAARSLARAAVRVTLLDARNHHLFQPLLYQVATAGLSPGDIAEPIRHIVRRLKNVRVVLGRAERIDRAARQVVLAGGASPLTYDYLVVATGVINSWFGKEQEWAEHAPGLKSVEEALEIRRRVLMAYEHAELEEDPARRQAWLTFVVVGGGPTGVELAGALAELSRNTLAGNFRSIDPREARVILCEGGDRILRAFSEQLSGQALRSLEQLGVDVRFGSYAAEVNGQGLTLGDERIDARTILWAAGVKGGPLLATLETEQDRMGRVRVAPDLSLPADPRVFVIGDAAAVRQGEDDFVPGVAPAAMQMGRHAGEQIQRALAGQPPQPFSYLDKGSMATIGRSQAIAALPGGLELRGLLAWLAWLAVHIMFLIGFRNRILVLIQWMWAYMTFQRGARLITNEGEPRAD